LKTAKFSIESLKKSNWKFAQNLVWKLTVEMTNSVIFTLHERIIHNFLPAWKRNNHNFLCNILGNIFSTEICILILLFLIFVGFETWIFTLKIGVSQTFEFPTPLLQCIYWNFFLHQRDVWKHFRFDEAEYNKKGICEEKCTICKKKLMWLSRFF